MNDYMNNIIDIVYSFLIHSSRYTRRLISSFPAWRILYKMYLYDWKLESPLIFPQVSRGVVVQPIAWSPWPAALLLPSRPVLQTHLLIPTLRPVTLRPLVVDPLNPLIHPVRTPTELLQLPQLPLPITELTLTLSITPPIRTQLLLGIRLLRLPLQTKLRLQRTYRPLTMKLLKIRFRTLDLTYNYCDVIF